MEITKNFEEGKLTVSIKGDIDSLTAPELDEALNSSLDGVSELVIDMQGVEYISSAGLRVILKAYKTMENQGETKLININETVKLIFKSTGLSDRLGI